MDTTSKEEQQHGRIRARGGVVSCLHERVSSPSDVRAPAVFPTVCSTRRVLEVRPHVTSGKGGPEPTAGSIRAIALAMYKLDLHETG